jgi:hypothetical protein
LVLVGAADAITTISAVVLTIGVIFDAAAESVAAPTAILRAGIAVFV